MIALLGATGHIGRHVAHCLAEDRVPALALVRNPARVNLPLPARPADLADAASRTEAMAEADRLFLLTPHGPDQDLLEANALQAAVAAGITRIVKVSDTAPSLGPNGPTSTAVAHWRSERSIEASGISFAFLRPSFLMQNLLTTVARMVARAGALAAPMGHGPIAMVDARDVAACAVACLTASDHHDDAYAMTGPSPVTFAAIAAHLGVPYIKVSAELAAWAMRRGGGSAFEIDHATRMAHYFASGADSVPTDCVRRLSGRPPLEVGAFLDEHAEAFSGPRLGRLAACSLTSWTKGS